MEERINNTLPNVDKLIDTTGIKEMQAGTGTVDDDCISMVLKDFYYLKQGLKEEKEVASRFREKMGQLNRTVSQLMTIMITCPCNVHPLTLHFYIVKQGFTGVFIFFLFLL